MDSARRVGQNECRVAFVEAEHLSVGVAKELSYQQGEQSALAGTSRTEHERMPNIADVKVEAKRSGSRSRRVAERGAFFCKVRT